MFKTKPLEMFRRPGLYLQNVHGKGRGLFCRDDIKKDEVIEVTPVLIFNDAQTPHAQKTLLGNYISTADPISQHLCAWAEIKNSKEASLLAMGVISFCNHITDPNAEIIRKEEMNTLYFTLKALRDIPKDTEIGFDYGTMWFVSRTDWGAPKVKEDKTP